MIRALCISAAVLVLPAAASACEATMEEYLKIRDGMTVAQVEQIIGCPGEELSSSSMAGFYTVMYMWEGNTMMGNMNAMFQNDALVSKAQMGLK